jgi:hypothetical protein
MLCYNIMDPQHTLFSYLMSPNSIKGGFHNRLFSTRIICVARHGAFYVVELMIQVPKAFMHLSSRVMLFRDTSIHYHKD